MKPLRDGATALLKMLGAAVVLALMILLVEVFAGLVLLAAGTLFG